MPGQHATYKKLLNTPVRESSLRPAVWPTALSVHECSPVVGRNLRHDAPARLLFPERI